MIIIYLLLAFCIGGLIYWDVHDRLQFKSYINKLYGRNKFNIRDKVKVKNSNIVGFVTCIIHDKDGNLWSYELDNNRKRYWESDLKRSK